MISIIIASYNEELLIGRAIKAFMEALQKADISDYEIIQVSSDSATLNAGLKAGKELAITKNFFQVKDPRKGKSFALNLALEKAKGEIIILSDGDVYIDLYAVSKLLKAFDNSSITGASGRPISLNDKTTFMGYLSHLTTDVADRKRREVFSNSENGIYSKENAFFPMSGYLLAYRNLGLRYNPKFIDDTYISLQIVNGGGTLAYVPDAKVYVSFPTSIRDYLVQRRRNIHGTNEIHQELKQFKDPRSVVDELKYFAFPITYSANIRELFYSHLFYPLRLATWVYAYLPKKNPLKSNVWEEIRSSKV